MEESEVTLSEYRKGYTIESENGSQRAPQLGFGNIEQTSRWLISVINLFIKERARLGRRALCFIVFV
jgi:hypothetical protein